MKKYIVLGIFYSFLSLGIISEINFDKIASIRALMDSIKNDLPTDDKQAKKLEKTVIKNIDLITKKHAAVFSCQAGTKMISRMYVFPFSGGASAGKSFSFMHLFSHAMERSIDIKDKKRHSYHVFYSFCNESKILRFILSHKNDFNKTDQLLEAINNKFILKPSVHMVFLAEAATALLTFMKTDSQFDDYLTKMAKEIETGQYSKILAFQRCIMRIQLAQMQWLYNFKNKLNGGIIITIKDRSEADSFGYCTAANIPEKTTYQFLPINLVYKLGNIYKAIFLFAHSTLPPNNKQIVEKFNGDKLIAHYKKLTTCILHQYKLIWPQYTLINVGSIDFKSPMKSQTQRMEFIIQKMIAIIKQDNFKKS